MNNIQKINVSFIGGLLAIVYNSFVLFLVHSKTILLTTTLLSSFITGFLLVYFSVSINDLSFGFSRRRVETAIHDSHKEKIKSYQTNK